MIRAILRALAVLVPALDRYLAERRRESEAADAQAVAARAAEVERAKAASVAEVERMTPPEQTAWMRATVERLRRRRPPR